MTDATFDAMDRWDGRWTVPKPADYTPGLYRVHQIEARNLLKQRNSLTKWEATFLQAVAYQFGTLSPGQRYWLARLEREAV